MARAARQSSTMKGHTGSFFDLALFDLDPQTRKTANLEAFLVRAQSEDLEARTELSQQEGVGLLKCCQFVYD